MRWSPSLVLLLSLLVMAPASPVPLQACDDEVASATSGGDEANQAAVSSAADGGAAECCRVCTPGRACGDTCIDRDHACNRPPGCACDAAAGGTAPAAAAEAAGPPPILPQGSCTVERIIDGDTFVCEGLGRIRLLMIDAPERSQGAAGRRATRALTALIPPGTEVGLELDVRGRDRYGRILAYVHTADGRMVNEELVRQGYAVLAVYPPNVRHVERIREAAAEARASRRGLWATQAFECSPAEHRAGRCR